MKGGANGTAVHILQPSWLIQGETQTVLRCSVPLQQFVLAISAGLQPRSQALNSKHQTETGARPTDSGPLTFLSLSSLICKRKY